MAARGSISKEIITKKIMEIFPEAFLVDSKELRIPMLENGEECQIKVALTCAKDNVSHGNGGKASFEAPVTSVPAMTDEEIQQTKDIIQRLNL